MISSMKAKIIKSLPKILGVYISKMLIDKHIDKYASIEVNGNNNLFGIKLPTIFVCNHLSNSDGLILNKVLKDINPTFVAGKKLSKNDVTNIGINVIKTTDIEPNNADKEGIKKIIGLIKKGESILIFPEGTRSRTASLIVGKKGIVLIARMADVPIVPIGIYGTEKLLPINEEGNMEAEVFHHAKVCVNIGRQFELPEKSVNQDKRQFNEYVLQHIMSKIAELLPQKYQGVYKK